MTRSRAVAVGLSVLFLLVAGLLTALVALDLIADPQPDPFLWDGMNPSPMPSGTPRR